MRSVLGPARAAGKCFLLWGLAVFSVEREAGPPARVDLYRKVSRERRLFCHPFVIWPDVLAFKVPPFNWKLLRTKSWELLSLPAVPDVHHIAILHDVVLAFES